MLSLLPFYRRYFVQFVRGLDPFPMFIQAIEPQTSRCIETMICSDHDLEEQAIERLVARMSSRKDPYKRLGTGVLYRVNDEHLSILWKAQ